MAAGRVGWRVNPDIAVPTNGGFPGTTYWTVQGDTIAVVWSNGFQATRLQLVLESGDLGGYAEVDGDAHEYGRELPRVAIVARRVSCMGVK